MRLMVRTRLSLVFLSQYFAAGAWMVSLGSYMSKTLAFDSIIAAAYSMVGFATIGATLFVGVIADRFFNAQKVLAFLSFGAAASLLWLSTIRDSPNLFLGVMLLHCVFYVSAIPMLATIAFNAIENPGKDYPGIRVFGSIGWVIGGLVVGMIAGAGRSNLPMLIAGGTYLAQGFYALTLPKTPPPVQGQKISVLGLFGFDILQRVRNASFWILMACVLFVVIPKKFYDSYANLFFVEKGLSFKFDGLVFEPTAIQTLGQIAEIPFMLMIPFLIARIGIKWVMVLGMVGWVVRFGLFAFGFSGDQAITSMLVAGILMHGLSYDFFFVSGQIYLDRLFDKEMRARAQAFYWFVLSGLGVVLGAFAAGSVYHRFSTQDHARDWMSIWLSPAAVTVIVALLFAWWFRQPPALKQAQTAEP